MMTSDYIINVNELSFEYEVISYSQNIPVVVDFWADWCRPCKILEPILTKLIMDANGAIRLARVNVDENPNLALQFSVRTLPTIKAFSDSQIVGELVGVQPEQRLIEFLKKIVPPSPVNLTLEKANSLVSLHRWADAESIFEQVLELEPEAPSALLGLAKSKLGLGKAHEAHQILRHFPASRQFSQAESLIPLAEALIAFHSDRLPSDQDLDFAYTHAVRLASKGNILSAIDGLLDILRQDKHYRDGSARRLVLSLLTLLGDDDRQTGQYRSELASILF